MSRSDYTLEGFAMPAFGNCPTIYESSTLATRPNATLGSRVNPRLNSYGARRKSRTLVSLSTTEEALPTEPEPVSVVYVLLNSGEVATISPATSVSVDRDVVIVYHGALAVASYARKDVFSCSRTRVSPAFT